jgi:hypothetical protein
LTRIEPGNWHVHLRSECCRGIQRCNSNSLSLIGERRRLHWIGVEICHALHQSLCSRNVPSRYSFIEAVKAQGDFTEYGPVLSCSFGS